MPQVTYNCNKDARIADNGTSLGAGTSDCNPAGLYGSYLYRTLLSFPVSYAGWTSVTSAYLKLKTSNQLYVAFGSDPDFKVQRLTSNWSEGSASSMSSTNAVEWSNQPGVTAGYVFCTPSESENTWTTYDITNIMREAFAAGVFYGFRISANNEATANDTTEFWSRESGNGTPQLIVNYETNVGPNAPTGCSVAAVGGSVNYGFSHSDNDGDALLNYDIQVSTDASFATFTHWNATVQTAGIAGNNVLVGHGGTALSRGVTYYWRVATRSATGIATVSGWTTGPPFQLNQLPTVAFVTPSAADALIEMTKVAGVATNPRMVVRWSFSDPDGGAQAKYQVVVVNDGGSAFWDSGVQNGAVDNVTVPVDAVRGNFYRVTVTVYDSANETATTGQRRCKAQWAVVEYKADAGAGLTAWSAAAQSTSPANTLVVTEYASSAAGGAIGAWFSSLASAVLSRWFHWRVWLFAWSGAASPSFNKMALTFTSSAGVPPDGWALDAQFALDTGTKVYGTQSLRGTGNGADHVAYQTVPIQKNTNYILSGRIKSDGNSQSCLQIVNAAHTAVLVQSPFVAATQDWTRVQTPVWNSGDAEAVIVRCDFKGAAGTIAWFDALKLEASTVVTSWNPGMVGAGVSMDAGGIKVDASPAGGATLRLQGSDGQGRSTVELGAKGLKFGGDTEMYSPGVGQIAVPGMYADTLAGFAEYSIRAGQWVTGGGGCSFDGSNSLLWNQRFIVIAQGNGAESAANGYFDINCPVAGTVTGVGGHANVTATAAGVVMGIWDALYVILPKGGTSSVLGVGDFRIAAYNGAMSPPPSNWLLLALFNGDDMTVYLANGVRLKAGYADTAGYKPPVRTYYAANNTWVSTGKPGLKYIEVECVGGGGGGGGTAAPASGTNATAGGGGGGGYVKRLIPANLLSGNYAVVVGGGGGGAAAGNNTGGTGGNSTFTGANAALVGGAGTGGGGMASTTGNSRAGGGNGGGGSGGDYLTNGSDGGGAGVVGGILSMMSYGGASGIGGNGTKGVSVGNSGVAGVAPGGGGTGSCGTSADVARAGGAGAIGCVIVTEYY